MIARYGASDLALLLTHFLMQVSLPFHRPILPSLPCDQTILDDLIAKHCSADALGLGESMQIVQYESREPEATTRKFEGKVYEEVCLAPLVSCFSERERGREWSGRVLMTLFCCGWDTGLFLSFGY